MQFFPSQILLGIKHFRVDWSIYTKLDLLKKNKKIIIAIEIGIINFQREKKKPREKIGMKNKKSYQKMSTNWEKPEFWDLNQLLIGITFCSIII